MDNAAPRSRAPSGGDADDGFKELAAAYDKPDDNRTKARLAFRAINPDEAELERMVASAASWKRTATGRRMPLERWLKERRWLSGEEPVNDNRPTHRYTSCVVTRIKPAKAGAQVWFRDRDGTAQTRVLGREELADLSQYSYDAGRLSRPSEDLHEFVGARFQLWEDGTIADPDVYEEEAA